MRTLKKWFTYSRNGIIYVQFKDKITGKKMTAKSTGTRDRKEADERINKWYYDPDSFFNRRQKQQAQHTLTDIFSHTIFTQEDVITLFQSVFSNLFIDAAKKNGSAAIKSSQPTSTVILPAAKGTAMWQRYTSTIPAIQAIYDRLETITFKEYLLTYFDYDNSPRIQYLRTNGKTPPEPERYKALSKIFNYYDECFTDTRLLDLTAEHTNKILGAIRNKNHVSEAYMSNIRRAFVETLRFAREHHIITADFTGKITRFSNENQIKAIFTENELHRLFDTSNGNVFGDDAFLLVNKLLLATGCRVGEILALQIDDICHTFDGYKLYIGKSYNFHSNRLKSTKTKREDYVPLSDELAQELFNFIETNPFKHNKNAFIFYSDKKDIPLHYRLVRNNFEATMKQTGIKRKNLTLHSYRHTFATILQDAGYSDSDMLYLTRHSTVQDTRRYSSHMTMVKEAKQRQAAELIAQFI
ncbi:MAG: site-specific integrase [Treponema sp.]